MTLKAIMHYVSKHMSGIVSPSLDHGLHFYGLGLGLGLDILVLSTSLQFIEAFAF